MRIAAVQMNVGPDPAANLAQAAERVAEAARQNARWALLPENAVFMGAPSARAELAEPLAGPAGDAGGPLGEALCGLAARHGLWLLVGGFPERSPDPLRPWNTSFLVAPDGRITARYRKIHLFDVDLADGRRFRESADTAAGAEVVTAAVDGVPVGLSVCYDLRFPELYRAHSAAGARVLCVPAAFTVPTGQAHWHLLLRARAVENLCYVVAPAQCGVHGDGPRRSYGHTLVVDPWGEVTAELADEPGVAVVDLDFAAQDAVRARLPVLAHRRLGP